MMDIQPQRFQYTVRLTSHSILNVSAVYPSCPILSRTIFIIHIYVYKYVCVHTYIYTYIYTYISMIDCDTMICDALAL